MAETPGLKKVKLSKSTGCCVILELDLPWSQSMEHKSAVAVLPSATSYASEYSAVSMATEQMENAFFRKTLRSIRYKE